MLPQKAQPGTNINYWSLLASELGCAWHYFNSSLPDTRCIPGFHYRFLRLPSWRLKVSSVQRRALDWTSWLRTLISQQGCSSSRRPSGKQCWADNSAESCFGKRTLKLWLVVTGLALETAGAWQKLGNKNLTQTGRPRANLWRSPRLAETRPKPPPPSTYFFSAGFCQVSARFPPGSAGFAGFLCRVPPPGSAGFRWVPLRQVSSTATHPSIYC